MTTGASTIETRHLPPIAAKLRIIFLGSGTWLSPHEREIVEAVEALEIRCGKDAS